jgi:F0F1-type ATP synthase delta subunit
MDHEQAKVLALPISVVGRVDLGRLIREVELLDEFLHQAAIREPGTSLKLPRTSRLMDEVIQLNQINVLVEPERQRLAEFLLQVRKHAPVLHISFSADPSPLFTQKLVTWLRREIHPFVLLQIGLQPNIGAGCVVRTTNQYFDFSLRQNFIEKRGLLAEKLIVGAAQ